MSRSPVVITRRLTHDFTVQEAAIAPQSVCYRGKHKAPLEHVLRVGAWLRYKSMHLSVLHGFDRKEIPSITKMTGMMRAADMFDLVDRDHGILHQLGSNVTLLDLLSALRPFEAHDPRDHVFGLLGFWEKSSKGKHGTPIADYNAPTAQVFQNAALFDIRSSGSLAIFRHITHNSESHAKSCLLPTWVPRWDTAWKAEDEVFLKPLFCAHNGVELASDTPMTSTKVLTLKGFVVAVIESAVPTAFRGFEATSADIQTFLSLAEELTRSARSLPADSFDEKIATTLQAGVNSSGVRTTEGESARAYAGYKYFLAEQGRIPTYEWALDDFAEDWYQHAEAYYNQTAAELHFAMEVACHARNFFTTTAGHIGLGPSSIRTRDFVVVIYGCQWPVILRPSTLDAASYELIGVSYVHGITDGEATKDHVRSGAPDVSFRIH